MTHYYNEFDSKAAAWLRQLIADGHIPDGVVDERSIIEVQPNDLEGFTQCHFFAGIGGWPLALKLAGWPADRPVWTGSCPCQPFSVAGQQRGDADERHLWPEFHRLISKRSPPVVFGEQVASKAGRVWLAGVRADMEALDYAVGAADLCAAGIGAPHIRQRLYWAGHTIGAGLEGHAGDGDGGEGRQEPPGPAATAGGYSWVGDTDIERLDGQHLRIQSGRQEQESAEAARPGTSGWGDHWIPCADGKARRVEPGLAPLDHGVPARVVRIRGYGNAIVPQLAAEFVMAFMEAA